MSETGSLDRMKAAAERRKKVCALDEGVSTVSGQVEGTRVNPDSLINEILKNAKLDQLEESAESKCFFCFVFMLKYSRMTKRVNKIKKIENQKRE